MYKFYLYFETTILTLLLMLIELIARPIIYVITGIKTAHDTAEFYSDNKLHIWQGRKAMEIYNKQLIAALKKGGKDGGNNI